LETLYEGYLGEPLQTRWHPGWRAAYGVVAYFAGRYEKAREQFEKIDWHVRPENLSDWGRELSLMTLEVAARTGPLGTSITGAEDLFTRQDTTKALQLYEELQNRPEADARTRQFIRHRLATLQLEQKFSAGEWIPLLPSGTNDPAWTILAGNVRTSGDGVVEVASEGFGHMVLCQARLGGTFEARGEIEFVTPAKEPPGPVGAGIAIGSPTWDAGHWYTVRLTRDAQGGAMARFARNWRTGPANEVVARTALKDGPNTFQFAFRDHRVSATVNERRSLGNAEATPTMRITVNNQRLALVAEESPGNLVVRYRNLQVRKN
jgi:tetratricopeptide (TPR) repeat protein